jgi:hypothetical protein
MNRKRIRNRKMKKIQYPPPHHAPLASATEAPPFKLVVATAVVSLPCYAMPARSVNGSGRTIFLSEGRMAGILILGWLAQRDDDVGDHRQEYGASKQTQ